MKDRNFYLPYFEIVQDENNWKNPINKTIVADEPTRANISDAIHFFTGTQATWKKSETFWNVTADGYYLGPCN